MAVNDTNPPLLSTSGTAPHPQWHALPLRRESGGNPGVEQPVCHQSGDDGVRMQNGLPRLNRVELHGGGGKSENMTAVLRIHDATLPQPPVVGSEMGDNPSASLWHSTFHRWKLLLSSDSIEHDP